MPFKSKAAMVVLVIVVAVIIAAALIAVRTWQHRGPSAADAVAPRVAVPQQP